jgi:hypothetical protein
VDYTLGLGDPDPDIVGTVRPAWLHLKRVERTGFLMAPIFQRIQTAGIAQLLYLVGDDFGGVAAVFDPPSGVECATRPREAGVDHPHF